MRIFYPTDFSEASLNAFIYAIELAKATAGEIITFHAYHLPDIRGAHLPHTLQKVYESISIEEFENYRDSIPLLREICEKQGCNNLKMSHVLQHGDPKTAILNAIAANQADIVVMGTSGAGMMRKLFVGSVAAEVMENANVPVLAIPLGAVYDGKIDSIAFATEMLEEDDTAMARVLEIAGLFDARVICLHADVAHTASFSGRRQEFLEKYPQVELHILDSLDAEDSINAFVNNHPVDILVMLIHKRNKIQELLTYSMTKRLAAYLKLPILAIQAHTLS